MSTPTALPHLPSGGGSPGFPSDSDVDVLVEFSPDVQYSLFGLAELKEELELLFRRRVDVVEPAAPTCSCRRRNTMQTALPPYAA